MQNGAKRSCAEETMETTSKRQKLDPDSNPVGSLYQLANKNGWSPVYTYIDIDGGKEFTVDCKLNQFKTSAHGSGKKLAKREAAAAMLKLVSPQVPANTSQAAVVVSGNKPPISLLNELCQKNNYKLMYSDKPSDDKAVFTIICRVNDQQAEGHAKTKKEAKNNAAKKMIEELKLPTKIE